jgi:hypothetical protein
MHALANSFGQSKIYELKYIETIGIERDFLPS